MWSLKNMNEITLRIKYKAQSKPLIVSISIEEDNATKEEIARLFAIKLTQKYSAYIGGKKSIKELKRYEFGQYKLILHELEVQKHG
jgi:hypothetical protein